jgi:hypothetical protein
VERVVERSRSTNRNGRLAISAVTGRPNDRWAGVTCRRSDTFRTNDPNERLHQTTSSPSPAAEPTPSERTAGPRHLQPNRHLPNERLHQTTSVPTAAAEPTPFERTTAPTHQLPVSCRHTDTFRTNDCTKPPAPRHLQTHRHLPNQRLHQTTSSPSAAAEPTPAATLRTTVGPVSPAADLTPSERTTASDHQLPVSCSRTDTFRTIDCTRQPWPGNDVRRPLRCHGVFLGRLLVR